MFRIAVRGKSLTTAAIPGSTFPNPGIVPTEMWRISRTIGPESPEPEITSI
jgi:hypothetical protein